MRALWTLVVCCLVAATSARDPVDDGYRASVVVRTAQTTRANASRASARTATAGRTSPSFDHQRPPGLAATSFAFHRPHAHVALSIVVTSARELAHVDIPGCSARGPPIA